MTDMTNYAAARQNMVEGQIRPNKVNDPALIAALMAVPRELFVPAAVRGVAYADRGLAIGKGRYLIEPMVFARLLQEAQIRPTENVLIVGGGTGYSTALVSHLAARVVAVESNPDLRTQATETLLGLGITNASVETGVLAQGLPSSAPYDVILIDGGVAEIPTALFDQLTEGGRAIAVVNTGPTVGRARLYLKVSGAVSSRALFDAVLPILPGFEAKTGFVF